jgi:hypothetical protein
MGRVMQIEDRRSISILLGAGLLGFVVRHPSSSRLAVSRLVRSLRSSRGHTHTSCYVVLTGTFLRGCGRAVGGDFDIPYILIWRNRHAMRAIVTDSVGLSFSLDDDRRARNLKSKIGRTLKRSGSVHRKQNITHFEFFASAIFCSLQ